MPDVASAAGSSAVAGKRRGHGARTGGLSATAGKLSRFAPSELQVRPAVTPSMSWISIHLIWLMQLRQSI